jgi:hypothetical protein
MSLPPGKPSIEPGGDHRDLKALADQALSDAAEGELCTAKMGWKEFGDEADFHGIFLISLREVTVTSDAHTMSR